MARCELVSQDEGSSSLRETVRTSQASGVVLTTTCNTLGYKVIARTSKIAALRARSPVVASGLSQSDYVAVVRDRVSFAFPLRSLAYHTSRLENDFADLCHRTWPSHFVMQRCIRPLF